MPNVLLYEDSSITLASGETAKVIDILKTGTSSYTSGITAYAAGGQTGATKLTASINVVTTVGSAAGSVALPVAVPGLSVYVTNGAASNSMQVFGQTPDTINGVATGTGVAQAAGVSAVFVCAAVNKWYRIQSS
jgi:hypothetical protein